MWQLLVGAGFALWRAIPLFEMPTRDPGQASHDADKVLYELVAHNRITYEQEQNARAWFAGYYLNDARWRIELARARERRDTTVIISLQRVLPDRDQWDAIHCSLKEPMGRLKRDAGRRRARGPRRRANGSG